MVWFNTIRYLFFLAIQIHCFATVHILSIRIYSCIYRPLYLKYVTVLVFSHLWIWFISDTWLWYPRVWDSVCSSVRPGDRPSGFGVLVSFVSFTSFSSCLPFLFDSFDVVGVEILALISAIRIIPLFFFRVCICVASCNFPCLVCFPVGHSIFLELFLWAWSHFYLYDTWSSS